MKVDGGILTKNPLQGADQAKTLEAMGYSGGFTFDGPHDPFLPLLAATASTENLDLITAIAVAFARSPMTTAQLAYDLQIASGGRFILGLGSQIKPHIERRFSMPWSNPAERMKEYVEALRAIWACWHEGKKLDFNGRFYTHTLMSPFLNPGPNPSGLPKVFLSGVGPLMTEVAGEVGDGFLVHPFNSMASLDQLTLPALRRGRESSGKSFEDFEISCQLMIAAGDTEEELATAKFVIKSQMAFYASTPAYKVVLDCHGLGELQPELQRMTRENRWQEMNDLIPDALFDAIAISGHTSEIAQKIMARCAPFADRVSLVTPYEADPARWQTIVAELTAP